MSKYFDLDKSESKKINKDLIKKFLQEGQNRKYLRNGDLDQLFSNAKKYDESGWLDTHLMLAFYFSDIEFLDKMSYIPEYLFDGIKFGGDEVVIPGNIKEIGAAAFYVCSRYILDDFTIKLSEGVKEIGQSAFSFLRPNDIDDLMIVEIPKSLNMFYLSSFKYCKLKVPYKDWDEFYNSVTIKSSSSGNIMKEMENNGVIIIYS